MSFEGVNSVGNASGANNNPSRDKAYPWSDDSPETTCMPATTGGDGSPFIDGPEESSMAAPPTNIKNRNRSSIIGTQRIPSFGQSRNNRAPSLSAGTDFSNRVARVSSIDPKYPIVEKDEDVDMADALSKTSGNRRSFDRTPLEPIMNGLQIAEHTSDMRRSMQTAIDSSRDAVACPGSAPRPPNTQFGDVPSDYSAMGFPDRYNRSLNASFDGGMSRPSMHPPGLGSFESNGSNHYSNTAGPPSSQHGEVSSEYSDGGFSNSHARSLNASFDGGMNRPVMHPPAYGSFESNVSSWQSNTGGRPFFEYGSTRSINTGYDTGYTSPSPYASLSSNTSTSVAIFPDPEWTPEEDKFLLAMWDVQFAKVGNTPFQQNRPPSQFVHTTALHAMAQWHIINFEKLKTRVEILEFLAAHKLPADGDRPRGSLRWVGLASEWRHDEKSTKHRLSRLAADLNKGPRNHASSLGTGSLADVFNTGDALSLAPASSIPLGSMASVPSAASDSRRVLSLMPPPPLPAAKSLNLELQISTGRRTSVETSSLPTSYGAPGASAALLVRAVKSLRGVPGAATSQAASHGASSGSHKQSQSLSAATGGRTLGSGLTFGPALSPINVKKRSREDDSKDADSDQRHNGPSPTMRDGNGLDQPHPENGAFSPPSLGDELSSTAKRQNRSRSRTVLPSGPSAQAEGRPTVPARYTMAFKPRALDFSSGALVDLYELRSNRNASNHSSSGSMPASLLAQAEQNRRLDQAKRNVDHGLYYQDTSIAEQSVFAAEHGHRMRLEGREATPSPVVAKPALGSLVGDLPLPDAVPTPERRRADAEYLRAQDLMPSPGQLPGGLTRETHRHLHHGGGLLPGMHANEIGLLAGIEQIEDLEWEDGVRQKNTAVFEQYQSTKRIAALTPVELKALRDSRVASARQNLDEALAGDQSELSSKTGDGFSGMKLM